MNKQKADIIVDLQFGSTGKGALAGYLAIKGDYDTVVTANRPNAGHTFINGLGEVMIHKVMPNSAVGPNVKTVLIGPGSIFDLNQLYKEIDTLHELGYNQFRVLIHEAAVVLTDEHRNGEIEYSRIGSTQQGAAVAAIHKMERDDSNSPLARDAEIDLEMARVITHKEYINELVDAKELLLEGAQGYSLGIDAGFWPYCTSRNCTVTQFMADMGVPHNMLRHVYGTARTYPIRVAGNSGPCYPDQEETSWENIGQKKELTTVTQKVRRVFTFSYEQITEAIIVNQPNYVFLNFCNYLETHEVRNLEEKINRILYLHTEQGSVKYFGWGPNFCDMQNLQLEDH